ncbi:MAG TPA: hypothetical protein VM305_09480 [Candidatus Limnocylindrales bacterium]|nr:hypothetical protein [Candidatus Limnocylindrales bacterium]
MAAKPGYTCPAEASGFMRVDRAGWWQESVAGFGRAGVTVYDSSGNFTAAFNSLAASHGFASGQALYEFIIGAQWDMIDLNRNDHVCMKARPINRANPGYFYTGLDDRASVP